MKVLPTLTGKPRGMKDIVTGDSSDDEETIYMSDSYESTTSSEETTTSSDEDTTSSEKN